MIQATERAAHHTPLPPGEPRMKKGKLGSEKKVRTDGMTSVETVALFIIVDVVEDRKEGARLRHWVGGYTGRAGS